MDLPERFVDHVRERRLLPKGARVLVACSGGADSTALAVLATECAERLRIASVVLAHLDHGLRPDSVDDRHAVEALAARMDTNCFAERREVVAGRDESPEEAARRVRYRFLEQAAWETRSTHVLTAHHMEDQAETVLQRVLRGTGPVGLAGILERRVLDTSLELRFRRRPLARAAAEAAVIRRGSHVGLVRPLLAFRREELRAFLRDRGVGWREDPTNVDGNERARLRSVGLAALAECTGRDPVPLLARLAANAAASTPPHRYEIGHAFAERMGDAVHLHAGFERLPQATRDTLLRDLAPAVRGGTSLTHDECRRLATLVAGEDADPVAGLDVEHALGGVRIVAAREPRPAPKSVVARVPGTTPLWDGRTLEVEIGEAGPESLLERLSTSDGTVEVLDAAALRGPLRVRTRRDGDRVRPLGWKGEARLGHVLQRRGVRARDRDRLPLVCDDAGIVWAVGACLAERVRVTADTAVVAVLRARRSA